MPIFSFSQLNVNKPFVMSKECFVICRACLKECDKFKSLFREGIIFDQLTTLAELLSYCTGLITKSCDEDEMLPTHLCSNCIQLLARAYDFKKTVLESDGILRNTSSQVQTEPPKQSSIECGVADMQPETTAAAVYEQVQTQVVEIFGEPADELVELANAAHLKSAMERDGYMVVVDNNGTHYVQAIEENEEEDEEEEDDLSPHYKVGEEVEVNDNENYEEMLEYEVDEEYTSEQNQQHEDDETFSQIFEDEDSQYEVDADGNMYETRLISEDDEKSQSSSANVTRKKESKRSADDDMEHSAELEADNIDCVVNAQQNMKRPFTKRMRRIVVAPNPEYQCKVCGKQLSNQNSFRYHMQLHSDVTPYLCNLCGMGFKTPNAYEGHMAGHNPNNPNTCDVCGRSYRQLSSLRAHMLKHTGEKPFECEHCNKRFAQRSGLKKHLLMHSEQLMHSCDICGKEFRYSSNLFAHMRIHNREKCHQCEECNKTFGTADLLKRHKATHTSDKPSFSCAYCSKTFSRRSSLIFHHDSVHQTDAAKKEKAKADLTS